MNTKLLLVVSAILNTVLLVCLARNRIVEAPSPIALVKTETSPVVRERLRDRVVTVTNEVIERLDWRSVESEDYRHFIANLRAIGCPEKTIADIIRADVNELFQSRRKALADSTEGFKFWKPGNPFARAMNPEMLQKQQELTREQRAILEELLGKEPGSDAIPENNPFTELLAFLSPQQQQQVAEIRERFKSTLQESTDGSSTPEERKQRVRQAERQMEQDLSRIMTPREKEEHDLRLSQTTAKMREHLAAFAPTEQEFRGIFRYRKEFEDRVAVIGSQPGGDSQQAAAEQNFYAQVRRILSEARYADFLRALGK